VDTVHSRSISSSGNVGWVNSSFGFHRMKIEFTYWDNSVIPPKFLYQVVEEDILVADELFKKKIGIDPMKKPTIGCQVKVVDEV
jgi:hypothetical protein